jgi:hypothetical protein
MRKSTYVMCCNPYVNSRTRDFRVCDDASDASVIRCSDIVNDAWEVVEANGVIRGDEISVLDFLSLFFNV